MKLLSINIEGDQHFDTVLPFIKSESPDVLCIQEVFENDLEKFKALGYTGIFAPMTKKLYGEEQILWGTALYSKEPGQNYITQYYRGSQESILEFDNTNVIRTIQNAVLLGDFIIDGELFKIGTTHFPWSPDGSVPDSEQIRCMGTFREVISKFEPHVICGDFNIPRHHNFLYEQLQEHYTDTIPTSYASSLDRNLHKGGAIPARSIMFDSYMVDYIFTQAPYRAENVRLQFGVSDHAGVIAEIKKG